MFPKPSKQPYYIYAPFYRSTSAGVKALYLLSHHLNSQGYKSYIIRDNESLCHKEHDDLFYKLDLFFLDKELLKFHANNGYKPIVIYSDTVSGNPLGAKNIVRYMMNYSNLFADIKTNDNEYTIAYSKKIADSLNLENNRVLFIPTSNTSIFYPPDPNFKRKGTCVYMGKYYDFHKGEACSLTKNSEVITRLKGTITPNQIANLFRKSELLYLYENSAIATEAVLCGCPAIFIPNKFLKEDEINLSQNELGVEGYGISTKPQTIETAKNNVNIGRENYLNSFQIFQTQLGSFIKSTQDHFNETTNESDKVIDEKYFNEKNILLGIIENNKNQDDVTFLYQDEFDKVIKELETFYPTKKFIKKIKLINSDERIFIINKILVKIKKTNIGRIIKKRSKSKTKGEK